MSRIQWLSLESQGLRHADLGVGIWDPVLHEDTGSGAQGSWDLGAEVRAGVTCALVVGVSGSIR